jgi:hypothetical protein
VGRREYEQESQPSEATSLVRREEEVLHATFKRHHLHGEWFKPAPELLSDIEAISA